MIKSLSSAGRVTYKLMRGMSLAALLALGLGGCNTVGTVRFGDDDVSIGGISPFDISNDDFIKFAKTTKYTKCQGIKGDSPSRDIHECLSAIAASNTHSVFAVNKRGIYMPACLLDANREKCTNSQPGRDKDGKIQFSLDYRADPNKEGYQEKYIHDFAEAIIAKLLANNVNDKNRRLFIFIHGGLNAESDWINKLAHANAIIEANENNPIYNVPLFIDWRSGPVTTSWDQLAKYDHGNVDTFYKKATAPLYLARDLVSGIGNTPSILSKLYSRFTDDEKKYMASCNDKEFPLYCIDKEAKDLPDSEIMWRRLSMLNPVKLGFPVLSGIGQGAWDNMLLRTRTLYHTPKEFGPDKSDALTNRHGALYVLLQLLEKRLKAENAKLENKSKIGITLVGHSMGAIVSNQMLLEFPDLPYKEIVYMAGADSVNNSRMALIPVMSHNSDVRFYNLSLHPLAETTEMSGYSFAPSGSLLEWIDYILTTPKSPMDRTVGKWENVVDTIHTFPGNLRSRMFFKRFGLSESDPLVHGAFSEVGREFWKPEFWTTEDMPEYMRKPFSTTIPKQTN